MTRSGDAYFGRRKFLKASVSAFTGLLLGTGSASAAWDGLSEWDRRHARNHLPVWTSGHRVVDLIEDGGQYRIRIQFASKQLQEKYGREVLCFDDTYCRRGQILEEVAPLAAADASPRTRLDLKRAIRAGEDIQLRFPETTTVGYLHEHQRAEHVRRCAPDTDYQGPLCVYGLELRTQVPLRETMAKATGPINVVWDRDLELNDDSDSYDLQAEDVHSYMSSEDRSSGDRVGRHWPGKELAVRAIERLTATGDRYVLTGEAGAGECPSEISVDENNLRAQDVDIVKPDTGTSVPSPANTRQYHIRAYTLASEIDQKYGVIGQVHYDQIDHGKNPFSPNSFMFNEARQEVQEDWKGYEADVEVYEEEIEREIGADFDLEDNYDGSLTMVRAA